jgi:REP element-mobilizing transposase RayT
LRDYDYSTSGAYFITICTQNKLNHFGDIFEQKMKLSEIGKEADNFIKEIPEHFEMVRLDVYVIMPNHIHLILFIDLDKKKEDFVAGTPLVVSRQTNLVRTSHVMSVQQPRINNFGKPVAGSISVIIQQFKSTLKRWCNSRGYEYFRWQSRFHDRVIRNEREYNNIYYYILENPANWQNDEFKN